jgi:hypothetical protein
MVLADQEGVSSTSALTDGPKVGDCATDTLTVTNPGGSTPPIIVGTNTGQRILVHSSDNCNKINIDVDTGKAIQTFLSRPPSLRGDLINILLKKIQIYPSHQRL